MRSLWLASAAIIISAGAACAQVSQSSPAPTGAPTAAPTTTAPGMSPGNEGSSGGSMSPSAMAPSGGTPAPTGAPGAASVTSPGQSPGNLAPAGSTAATPAPSMAPSSSMSSNMAAPMPMKPKHHHMGMMGMAMPADGSAIEYLHYAKGAIKHHDKTGASNALAMAETRMLNGSVPQGQIAPDTTPAISSIEKAQTALSAGNMPAASAAVDMAMSQSRGMGSGSMAPPPSPMMTPAKPMASSNKSPGEMGGEPLANETSDSAAAGGTSHIGSTPQSSPPAP